MFFARRKKAMERFDRVVHLYLAYKFFGALYFTYPIFYEFASRAITPIQIGLFFSVIGLCGLIAEIPTGLIADKQGRKFSGLAGVALIAAAPLIIFFGHTFSAYLVAASFYGVGRAFLSGALDSLVYDHKNVSKAIYRRVNVLEITWGQAGILVSAAFGGVLFSVNNSLPFITEAVAGMLCLVIILCMKEEHKDGYIKSTSTHRKHFTESLRHLLATKYLRVIVLMGITFSVMLGMCIQFVHEASMIEHGLQATSRGFLISGAGVVTLIILNLFLLRLIKSDNARLLYMSCGAFAAYSLMSLGVLPLFMLGYLICCCLNATSSFIRLMIQDRIPSSHRSTIMSSYTTLAVLLGMGASIGTGWLVEWAGTPRAGYLAFAVISVAVVTPCAVWLITNSTTRA